jgi:hypothetical protein
MNTVAPSHETDAVRCRRRRKGQREWRGLAGAAADAALAPSPPTKTPLACAILASTGRALTDESKRRRVCTLGTMNRRDRCPAAYCSSRRCSSAKRSISSSKRPEEDAEFVAVA